MPLASKVTDVIFVGSSHNVTNGERVGIELKVRDAFRHVRTTVHVFDTITKVIASREDSGTCRTAHSTTGVKILKDDSTLLLDPI